MKVSPHARSRYLYRVDELCFNPTRAVQRAWDSGKEATHQDLVTFKVRPQKGATYRVAAGPNQRRFLMLARGKTVITVLKEPTFICRF